MATTRLISMHVNKGKTIAQCLTNRTNYAKNPDKTGCGELVSVYQCDVATVDTEFLLAKRQYQTITGREQRQDKNVLVYQIRHKLGEIAPEDVNIIRYELAMRFTKGKHVFIMATYVDKAHIHSHIIFQFHDAVLHREIQGFFRFGPGCVQNQRPASSGTRPVHH